MNIQQAHRSVTPFVSFPSSPLTPCGSKETVAKIRSLAKSAFLHVSLAIALNLTVMTFVATPLSVVALTGALGASVSAFIIQTAIDYYYQVRDTELLKQQLDSIKFTSQASMMNVCGLAGPNIVLHEAGHAATAWALFKKASPEVKIYPFLGGVTSFTYSYGLTKVGSYLGQHRSFMIITMAGVLASTFCAMFEFGLSSVLEDHYPTLSRLLSVHGALQIAQEVLYGLTAFIANKADLSHDFINLWISGGIHPLIPIAMIVIFPLLEVWAINYLKNREKSQKVTQAALSQCFSSV